MQIVIFFIILAKLLNEILKYLNSSGIEYLKNYLQTLLFKVIKVILLNIPIPVTRILIHLIKNYLEKKPIELKFHIFVYITIYYRTLFNYLIFTGIGADDVFIFCKVWGSIKEQKSISTKTHMIYLVQETMKHSVPAMFVTTLTTAVAFFASIVSNVTAVNCFR